MCRTNPPSGYSSGTTLGVPSEALLHLRMSPGHSKVRLNRFTGTTRPYTSVPSVLHCNVEEYGRRKQRTPVSYDIEVLKVAATYSPTTQCSTIGDAELNDPVRNGKGWDLSAITTLIWG